MQQSQPVQPYDVSSSDQLVRGSRAHEVESRDPSAVNVHSKERLASLVLGGITLALAATRRAPYNTLMAALGSALVYRGATGHCHLYQALGVNTLPREST